MVEDSCDCVPAVDGGDYSDDYSDDYNTGGSVSNCDFVEFFRGVLNLKEYHATERETDVSIVEQSLNQKLTSRLETDIDLFGTDTIDGSTFTNINTQSDITLHSKALTFTAEFNIINTFDAKIFPAPTDTLYMEIPLYLETSEGFSDLADVLVPPLLHDTIQTAAGEFLGIWHNLTGKPQVITIDANAIGEMIVNPGNNFPSTASRFVSLQLKIGYSFDSATQYFMVSPTPLPIVTGKQSSHRSHSHQ